MVLGISQTFGRKRKKPDSLAYAICHSTFQKKERFKYKAVKSQEIGVVGYMDTEAG